MCCTFVYDLPVKLNQRWSDEQFVNYWVNNEIAKLGKNCLGEVAEVHSESVSKESLWRKELTA